MLSAGGLGAGSTWTAMHKSPAELMQNVQWRRATALRLGVPPDAGPRAACSQKVMRVTCANSRLRRIRTTLLLRVRRSESQLAPSGLVHVEQIDLPGREVMRTCRGMSPSCTTGRNRSPTKTMCSGVQFWMWSLGFLESCSNSGLTSACGARRQNVTMTARRNQARLRRERRKGEDTATWFCCALPGF